MREDEITVPTHRDRDDEPTPRNGHDDSLPFRDPKTAAEIAANSAASAHAIVASLHEQYGRILERASAVETIGRENERRYETLRLEIAELRKDVITVAKALGARRTISGEMQLSIPPSLTGRGSTDTGSHIIVDKAQQEALERQFSAINDQLEALEEEKRQAQQEKAVAEAERRGADELRAQQRQAELDAETTKDAKRKRVSYLIGVGMAVATALSYLAGYVHHEVRREAPAAQQRTP